MENLDLKISGMSCSACVSHATKALENVAGVSEVDVDLASASAHIKGRDLDAAQLIAAVEEEGYTAAIA